MYAISGDHDVSLDGFAICEFQSCRSGALFKSNTAMARADGAWGEACCECIQQVGPVHAVYAIPAVRVGRHNRSDDGPVRPVILRAVTNLRANFRQGFAQPHSFELAQSVRKD